MNADAVSARTETSEENLIQTDDTPLLKDGDRDLFERLAHGPTVVPAWSLIHDAIEEQMRRHPDAIAAEHKGESIDYGELGRRAEIVATVLRSRGVGQGDNVGLFLERSIPMLVGMLGILRAGAAYVPQHVGVAPISQLEQVVRAAGIKVALTLERLLPAFEGTAFADVIAIEHAVAEETVSSDAGAGIVQDRRPQQDPVCFVLFTSGTTGVPNGVRVTHRNLCNILLTAPGDLGIRPGTKVSQILSISFDMAAWEILGCLSHGGTLLIRGHDLEETVRRVDVVIATPSILGSFDPDKCRNVRTIAVAGEPCPQPLAEKWAEFATFYNSCGPTEVTIVNTMHRVGHGTPFSIGRPTPNNSVYILDAHLRPCAIGEVGEMWAGGDCVTAGYVGNDILTADRYRPDPFRGDGRLMFRTRDLGRWNENGELEHRGRTDDQVKVRGFRVELDSVSAALERAPGCTQAVSLKLDNRSLVAFVRPSTVDLAAARSSAAEMLPYYCQPWLLFAVDEFPTTSRGKIDKSALLAQASALREGLDADSTHDIVLDDRPQGGAAARAKRHRDVVLPAPHGLLRRMWRHPLLMHYWRLAAAVMLVNIVLLGAWTHGFSTPLAELPTTLLADLMLANFALAFVVRQQRVVNLFFWLATRVPTHWPLRVRWTAGKVYHFGGLHVGGFFAGTVLLGALTVRWYLESASAAVLSMGTALMLILLAMIVTALPGIRYPRHNLFERVARFGTWASIPLFWVLTVLILTPSGDAPSLLHPQYLVLALITFSVILPWLHLRRVSVDIHRPSGHVAIAEFDHGVTPFAGSSTDLSRSPLLEWHSFANVPSPDREGFRLTISRAGDWTGSFISDAPETIWVKGIPTAGVGNIETLFRKVLWVATGSGIGPCLPHLLKQEVPAQLVWSTRDPRVTYGDELVDEILAVQPDAVIWNTQAEGKPDMVRLAYQAYVDSGAEAVICISNRKLTWEVVYGLESRGIPAFGAIWDS